MTPREVIDRITAYLTGGGLFNPELANHDAVRDLLIDARDALSLAAAVKESGDEIIRKLHNLGLPDPNDERDPPSRQIVRQAAALLVSQADALKRKDAEIAGLRDEVAILNNVRALWPEIRQLHEGFMASDPSAWTEWDQSVRERSIALSFDLNRASRQKE